MASKQDLEREIKALRGQFTRLQKRCWEREDRLIKLIEIISPFLPALEKAAQQTLEEQLSQAFDEIPAERKL